MRNDCPGNRPAVRFPLCLALIALLAPTSGAAAPDAGSDSAGSPAPAVEIVNLSAQGAFSAPSARVGDSLDYVLSVEWPETGVPVMVLAPDSLDFQGFQVIGQATSHKKLATAQGIGNRSEFVYRLRTRTPGSGKVSALKLRYLTGLSREEQSHFVPPAHLDIGTARAPLTRTLWFRLLAGWLALAAAGALGWAAYQAAARRRKAGRPPAKQDLRPEVLALKGRLRAASLGTPGASKSILEEMESLCIRHLLQELDGNAPASSRPGGSAGPAAGAAADGGRGNGAAAKFDPLLDRYLARNPAAEGEWGGMRELFRHARFAGGHKEPHELQDAYRALRKCLRITDEPGED